MNTHPLLSRLFVPLSIGFLLAAQAAAVEYTKDSYDAVLENLAGERDDLKIVKLNTDENQATAGRYQVLSIPTMIVFKNGAEAARVIGAKPKRKLEAELAPVIG